MAARPDSPVTAASVDITNDMELAVLDVGVEFTYTIPSFSVISVKLRQCGMQLVGRDGSVHVYDGFVHSDPSLNAVASPFNIKRTSHYFVPVSHQLKLISMLGAVDLGTKP